MRIPRMTTRRWMVAVAVAAFDLTLIVQRASHPLALVASFGTFAFVVLSPLVLLLLILGADD